MGFRRKPVLGSLPRSHPLNIFLGRLINSMGRRGAKTPGKARIAAGA